MSQLVKMKRQANFKDFKRFGVFNGLVDQKNVVFNSFVCKLGLFWHSKPILHTNSLNKPTSCYEIFDNYRKVLFTFIVYLQFLKNDDSSLYF
jgi:hypothetical protein